MSSLFSFLDSCYTYVGMLYNVPKILDTLFIFLISLDWIIPIMYVQGHLFFLLTSQICYQHLKTIRLLSCPEVIFVWTVEYLISNLQSVLNSLLAYTLCQSLSSLSMHPQYFSDTVENLSKAIYGSLISRISLFSSLASHSPNLKLQSCSSKPVHSNSKPSLVARKVMVFLSYFKSSLAFSGSKTFYFYGLSQAGNVAFLLSKPDTTDDILYDSIHMKVQNVKDYRHKID